MHSIPHLFLVISISVALLLGWWFVYVPLLVWYAVYTDPWWIVVVAIIIDGYYGAFYMVPYQSLLVFMIVFVMSYLRPYFLTRSVTN